MHHPHSAGAWKRLAHAAVGAILLGIVSAWLPPASARSGTAGAFRPYADGYWVQRLHDGPSRYYGDVAGALDDATRRRCLANGYVNCRWANPQEVESASSNRRYVHAHVEYDILYHFASEQPTQPVHTERQTYNSLVIVARSCPAGHALVDQSGFPQNNASLDSAQDEFTCRPFDGQPSDRQLGVPSSDGPGQCDGSSTLVGNPIDAATSNKLQVVADIPLAGASPLQWTRYYNSGGFLGWNWDWPVLPQRRYLGSRWRGSYDTNLEATRWYDRAAGKYAPALKRHRPDGGVALYEWHGDRYVAMPGDPARLEALSAGEGGGWRYTDADDNVERYDAEGRLLSLTDRRGQEQRLRYSDADTPEPVAHGVSGKLIEVSDAQGRSLRFTYDPAGRIATIADPAGATLRYRYDETDGQGLEADLAEVIYADGRSEGYRYRDSPGDPQVHDLTGVIDGAGRRYATYTYTDGGRAIGSEHAGGAGRVVLNVPDSYGDVTDARGTTRDYRYQTVQGLRRVTSVVQPAGAGCPRSAKTWTYDDAGRVATRTDRRGQITAFRYTDDGRGLEAMRIEALGTPQERSILTDWHPRLRLPLRVRTVPTGTQGDAAAAAHVLDFNYDERGNLLSREETGAGAPASRRWNYAYDDDGRLLSADGPRTDAADLTRFAYRRQDADGCAADAAGCAYRRGDLWTVTDALGHVAEVVRYDGAGRPLSIKDPNGVTTDLAYTPRGWLAELRVRGAVDAVTRYDYDANGQLAKSTDPDGVSLSYTYDAAHRLARIEDALGGRIDLGLNAAGDVTTEALRDKSGQIRRSLTRAFDALGRMKSLTGADGARTSFEYDANGNLARVVRPLGQAQRFQHDALDRVVAQVGDARGLGAAITQEHDSQDRLVAVTDPKGLATRYGRNGLGDLLEQRSPDTGATAQDMDAAGNVVRRTDARGQVRRMRYDALQRLLETSFDGAPEETIRYTYDQAETACPPGETYAIGRLSRIVDASGSTVYCYNALGQLTRKRQSNRGTTLELAYTYTPAGRLASLRYPDGHTAVHTREASGRIAAVDVIDPKGARQSLVKEAAYLPFGPATQWRYGNGRTLARRYDANGRPVAIEDSASGGLAASFGYDANGRLVRLGAPGRDTPELTFVYDGLDRLTETRDGSSGAVLERYGYDLTGNRVAFADANGEQVYTYPSDSHRLTAVAGQLRRYDAMGNLVADDGRNRQFAYNAMGRMAEVREGVSLLRRYAYNAWGEQVLSSDGGDADATIALYDERGHWLGDYDHQGRALQQIVWLDHDPVGLLQAGNIHYVESDHLGTPRVVIDPQRDVAVWRWDLKGEVFGSTPPDEDADRDGHAFVLDMRFPGQRYDRVTGLNYNYRRDYDFLTGRYAQSDPLGLLAGVSTYGYVLNNPLAQTDREGLMTDLDLAIDLPRYVGAVGLVNTYRAGRDGAAARKAAELSGLPGLHDGPADAYRHCVWSCLMTQHIGLANARAVADIYESREAELGQDPREKDMDDINNVIGRQCGVLMDGKDCQARCMDAVHDQRLLLIRGG